MIVRKLLLVGGGGHCCSCIDVINHTSQYEITGIIDQKSKVGELVEGVEIIGTDDQLKKWINVADEVLVTLGMVGYVDKRAGLFKDLKKLGAKFATVVSPRAYVSQSAKIGQGTIVMHDALINAGALIGQNCIVNTKALVEHDSIVEDHCHISTRASLNGGVIVRENSFIGSHAVVFQDCEIGKNSAVGGGERIRKSVSRGYHPGLSKK